MPKTYEPIATTTLGSDSATVEFTNISQSFTDLVVVISAGDSTNDERDLYIQVGNNSYDTGTNYSRTILLGDGSSASSGRTSNVAQFRINGLFNNTPNQLTLCHFMNYSNTTTNKTMISRFGFASNLTGAFVGLWRSTSAINQIKLFPQPTSNFITGSTFTLYGIKAA